MLGKTIETRKNDFSKVQNKLMEVQKEEKHINFKPINLTFHSKLYYKL